MVREGVRDEEVASWMWWVTAWSRWLQRRGVRSTTEASGHIVATEAKGEEDAGHTVGETSVVAWGKSHGSETEAAGAGAGPELREEGTLTRTAVVRQRTAGESVAAKVKEHQDATLVRRRVGAVTVRLRPLRREQRWWWDGQGCGRAKRSRANAWV